MYNMLIRSLLVTCSADTEIQICSRNKDKKDFILSVRFVGHKKRVWDCGFSLDSKYLISCPSDNSLNLRIRIIVKADIIY
jgi:WD40 repeat protein